MFICNIKMNSSTIKKIGIITIGAIALLVFIFVFIRFFKAASAVRVNDKVDTSKLEINNNNYTSILKDAHDNIDKYVGKKIQFTGFIYRLYDFKDTQFVLAREMLISSDNQAVVVGFLSECGEACTLKDGTWVEIEGVIEKGYYHGNIPVIKIKSLKETTIPKNDVVYPPDGSYINSEV